jgi:Flp pilus assembly protein TadB
MSAEESLHDVNIREKQLQSHILSSPEYLHKADQELKRQVTMLYLAIALLLVFQGLFTFRATGLPLAGVLLMTVTSILAIVNCLLLIRTKTWLRKLNEAWLAPQERVALRTIRSQRTELLTRIAQPSGDFSNAALN